MSYSRAFKANTRLIIKYIKTTYPHINIKTEIGRMTSTLNNSFQNNEKCTILISWGDQGGGVLGYK